MINSGYIYLISGLRELALDGEQKGLDVLAILDETFEQLSTKDARLLRLLLSFNDCENLISFYGATDKKNARFNTLGVLSKEDVEAIISGAELNDNPLPEDLQEVVSRFCSKGGVGEAADAGASFAHELFEAYYKECESSKSKVLRAWTREDRNIRNVIAALTARQSEREIEGVLVGEGSVVDSLIRSSAADFSLRGELNYIDALIAAVVDEENMLEKEHKIDLIRWNIIDEMCEMEYFSFDALLGYMVKLGILARWQKLDSVRGKEIFAQLLSSLSREIK